MSLHQKQYREPEALDDFPFDLKQELLQWMHCVGVYDLTDVFYLDEFVLRTMSYQLVQGAALERQWTEEQFRQAKGLRLTGQNKTRAIFKRELGELALQALGINL